MYWSMRMMMNTLEFKHISHDNVLAIGKDLEKGRISKENFINWWMHWCDHQGWGENDLRREELKIRLNQTQISQGGGVYRDFYPFIQWMLLEMGILNKY